MKYKTILGIIAAIIFMIISASAYTIDETEQVIVTQFNKIIGSTHKDPGLYFKLPFFQKANYFPKNLLEWDGVPGQIPTLEKTYIWIDTFARWKIVEAVQFFETVNNIETARRRLDDIIDPAVRNLITSNKLIEIVRTGNQKLYGIDEKHHKAYSIQAGRKEISKSILRQAQPKLKKFGIELVDVQIKRINYVEQVRKSVYGRMIAERKQIAEKFRSEGQGESRKILGEKERELKKISSEAYKTAQKVMGQADAKATKIYADAYGKDADFYSFMKTLDIYSTTLENSSLILSTDSEFLKYLTGYSIEK